MDQVTSMCTTSSSRMAEQMLPTLPCSFQGPESAQPATPFPGEARYRHERAHSTSPSAGIKDF